LGSVAEELSGGGREEPETVPCALGSVEMNCRVVGRKRGRRRCPVRWVAWRITVGRRKGGAPDDALCVG